MTDRPTGTPMSCDEADDLAGAWALEALEPAEADAVARHLETCDRPHPELRDAGGVGSVLAAALDPIEPSAALRDRVMGTIASQPRTGTVTPLRPRAERREWIPRVVAGLAVAAAVVLAVWAGGLRSELADRDAQLRQLAQAVSTGGASYRVEGDVGGGILVSGDEAAIFVADLEPAGEGMLYEMWLFDANGVPVPAGTFEPGSDDPLVVAPLDLPLEGFTAFAITREEGRVEAPTSDPVLATPLGPSL
jgi:anti-sigma-K factor RskA